jgi:hypothetical protein
MFSKLSSTGSSGLGMAARSNSSGFRGAIECLCAHHVAFIVVGGIAAVLNGAPISTFDLDIVHQRTPENVARLMAALSALDARYRDLAGRVLRPQPEAIAGDGHHLLLTNCGPVDVLGRIGDGEGFEALLRESNIHLLGELKVPVLNLSALIRTKQATGREKDLAVLPILRRTLAESDS